MGPFMAHELAHEAGECVFAEGLPERGIHNHRG